MTNPQIDEAVALAQGWKVNGGNEWCQFDFTKDLILIKDYRPTANTEAGCKQCIDLFYLLVSDGVSLMDIANKILKDAAVSQDEFNKKYQRAICESFLLSQEK